MARFCPLRTFRTEYLRMARSLWCAIVMLPLVVAPVLAMDDATTPIGENVIGGTATITRPAIGQLEVKQTTNRAVINWQHFNIGKNAAVTFRQPDKNALAVNRVTGGDAQPTQILGRLRANGQVMVLDKDGVIFGKNAITDVAGLVASSSDVDPVQVMGGGPVHLIKGGTGGPGGAVDNQGTITIREGGMAALVAPTVRNSGTITANMGRVTLAGGEVATVDLYGDGLLEIAVSPNTALEVTQTGRISADGGQVMLQTADVEELVGNVVNAGGTVQADQATLVGGPDGIIRLHAGRQGDVALTGQYAAAGNVAVDAGRDISLQRVNGQDAFISSQRGEQISLNAGRSISTDGDTDYIRLGENTALQLREGKGENLTHLSNAVQQMNDNRIDIALGNGVYAPDSVVTGNNIHIVSADPAAPATLSGQLYGLKLTGSGNSVSNIRLQGGDIGLLIADPDQAGILTLLDNVAINGTGANDNAVGLQVSGANLRLQNSTITGFGGSGIWLDEGLLALDNVTLDDNRIGTYLTGGTLDLTGNNNMVSGGDYGLVMDNVHSGNPLLLGDTFGSTGFSGQALSMIQLQNGAGAGRTLDASRSRFNLGGADISPAAYGNKLATALYTRLANMLVDRTDDARLGLVYIGKAPLPALVTTPDSMVDHTERYLGPPLPDAPALKGGQAYISWGQAELSPVFAADLNGLEPAAGPDKQTVAADAAACALDGDPASLLAGGAGSCI